MGDTVTFSINGSHDAREVSQTTWNANSSAALLGGFQVPFGGGTLFPAQLGVGTHYYVCTNHISMGMKGTIIVQKYNWCCRECSSSKHFYFSKSFTW
ncbi:MAG: hypothetical protein IPK10_14175 [Bacteroidetes bacterium]|nr:hypothetical protein [Bacteroidota bacterium]